MAGGFGGDDEDFSQYEDEEELDEESEESEDEEDEEESFADESDMDPIQKKIFELEEKRLKPKLKNMLEKVNTRQVPLLTPFEKRDFDKAKKHKNLKKDVTAITLALGTKKAQFSSKVMSTIAPAIPVICYALLIFLAIVIFLVLRTVPLP